MNLMPEFTSAQLRRLAQLRGCEVEQVKELVASWSPARRLCVWDTLRLAMQVEAIPDSQRAAMDDFLQTEAGQRLINQMLSRIAEPPDPTRE